VGKRKGWIIPMGNTYLQVIKGCIRVKGASVLQKPPLFPSELFG
jgi:hypothetical protein